MTKCKNCGREIKEYGEGRWYHVSRGSLECKPKYAEPEDEE